MSSPIGMQKSDVPRDAAYQFGPLGSQKYRKIDHREIPRIICKLSTKKIFEKIRKAICFISDDKTGTSKTGFFLKSGRQIYVITTAKDLSDDPKEIKLVHGGGGYELKNPENLTEGENSQRVNLRVFECFGRMSPETDFLEMVPNEIDSKIGTKIYFAGFPLKQTTITFHKGMISSMTTEDSVHSFTVDATVVKGYSGSPVVIQKKGRLYVTGVVTSQATGSRTIDESNLSTGIGKAVDIKHIYECLKQEEMDPERASFLEEMIREIRGPSIDESVGRKKGGIKTRIVKDILQREGYALTQGGNHEVWTKQNCDSISVTRGNTMDKYIAKNIMKTVAEDNNLDAQALKSLLR